MGKILLRKLRPRGKVYVARSYRKSRGVGNAHFIHCRAVFFMSHFYHVKKEGCASGSKKRESVERRNDDTIRKH